MEVSDADILKAFRAKNTREKAFTQLVRKYQQRLYWHIRRLVTDHDDTDDVLQNTFIKVWSGLEGFREESQLYTWLYRIATNETLTFLNNKNRRNSTSFENVSHQVGNSLSTSKNLTEDEIEMRLQKAIDSLPEKQKIVFNLRYYDEMPYEDMAKVLQTSVGALKASYHHAVKKVEESLLNH